MTTMRIFGGVDLSQTGLALVAVPVPFDLEWGRVQHVTVGETLGSLSQAAVASNWGMHQAGLVCVAQEVA